VCRPLVITADKGQREERWVRNERTGQLPQLSSRSTVIKTGTSTEEKRSVYVLVDVHGKVLNHRS